MGQQRGSAPAWAGVLALVTGILGCGPLTSEGSSGGSGEVDVSASGTGFPVMFVTQVPIPSDFTNVVSTFGNQEGHIGSAPRGGDLWIRYATGRLRNLTRVAGYGNTGLQGDNSIAVREPCVHWSGRKAVFSMVVGAPGQYENQPYRWQLYEVVGLDEEDTPVITKIANQPTQYNNVSPIYASDDRILFTSDRPRNGASHLYPQLDEYEEQSTNTGIWSLDRESGALTILNHAPSGAFSPRIDSFGRVIFTRWDHLERDQQADDDHISPQFGTFNWSSEASNSVPTNSNAEVFPEPRDFWIGYVNDHPNYSGQLYGYEPYLNGNNINHFFPWMMNQDGTEEETLNHVGRHELHSYFPGNRNDDPKIVSFLGATAHTANNNNIMNMFQIREDPRRPGTYYGIDAPEFKTHAAGQVIRLHGPPGMSPDDMVVDYVTHRDTSNVDDTPSAQHSGLYRNPLPLTNGKVVVVHTSETRADQNIGSNTHPRSRYAFRLKFLVRQGGLSVPGRLLTEGLEKSIQYWSPNELITYDGELWELDPVEVVARPPPSAPEPVLAAPELRILQDENVTPNQLSAYLRSRNAALIVSRNVTRRDRNDRQQPFNLRVTGTTTVTTGTPGYVYPVSHMQIFQGDQLRSLTFGSSNTAPGRRVIAQPMHEPGIDNPPAPGSPDGSVKLGDDGSMAAIVPARRALTWQLTDPAGEGIVRERYWLTFQPGEIRTCVACHGLSSADQSNDPPPTNPPEALRELLQYLKAQGSL
jgi:hypothetical protein